VLVLERRDVDLYKPNRKLDRNRDAVVAEHEALHRLLLRSLLLPTAGMMSVA
jgi:hypothetical protein